MCGICGIYNFDIDNPVDASVIRRMSDAIVHRGPDDSGEFIEQNVGLGFRRLSIIDLTAGHQPMANETDDIWIVFNGEIYNHADLRQDLMARGHVYRTRADTETIIHLYEEYGVDGFLKMNGMFAFAIWDRRKRRLLLARDRLGIKPLHYSRVGDSLVFGSEIKAIQQHPGFVTEMNEDDIAEQLIFRFIAGDKTLFKNVHSLLPGHLLICENGNIETRKFWDVHPPDEFLDIDEATAVDQLEELLSDSVRLRLMSDVPLGTFCSGGVDSGLTTAFARRHTNAELNTFSIGFHESDWDETRYAGMVSEAFKTTHHVLRLDRETYAESLPRLIWYNDEPLHYPSTVLIHHLSKLARERVTVVLTGEGADELFGGYPRFQIPRLYQRASFMPKAFRYVARAAIRQLPARKLNKLGYYLPLSAHDVALYNSAQVLPEIARGVVADGGRNAKMSFRNGILDRPELDRRRLTENTMYLDLKVYIPSLLNRQDKMSMAASIESRVPFLDYRLVEWGIRVPTHLKMKATHNKHIVKLLAAKKLPEAAINRPKIGFGVPIVEWLRDPRGVGRYLELFYDDRYKERGYLRTAEVHRLVDEHRSGRVNHAEVLWNLINLELWHRIFIEKCIATPLNSE